MFNRKEKVILALMSAVHFCLIVDFMVVMPQGPQLMRSLGISAARFGLLVSAYTFGAGVLSLAASFFIDRFNRKPALLAAVAGFAVCNLLCAVSSGYDQLFVARGVTGAFGGVVGSLLFSIVSDAIDLKRRASALGLVMSAFAVASIVGVPLCLMLSNRWGWQASFYFLAVVTTLIGVALQLWLPSLGGHLDATASRAITRFRKLLFHPSRGLALAFMSFLILGHFTIIPFLFPSVVANAGITEARLPVIYLVGGAASIVSTVLFGKLADRHGKKLVFAVALLASLAPIYLVTHLRPMPLWGAVAIVSSFFVLMGGRLTPATALVTSTVLPQSRGAFMSLVGSVQQLSAALAAFVAGRLVTKAPDGSLHGFADVGYLAVGFSLVALALSTTIVSEEK
ncbi:MAG: MFS transporter [Deltaproteobacteria bacterium]|nr:MFS transporter [Deltaproteobacteria bacterium]